MCPLNSEAVSVCEIPSQLVICSVMMINCLVRILPKCRNLPLCPFSVKSKFHFLIPDMKMDGLCTDEDYVDWVNINHPGFLPTISDVQIPVHTEPLVSDTLAASRMILSGSPLTDVVDSDTSTLNEPNVSDAIVIPTDTLPKNPTTLMTDITNVSQRQSTTTLTSTMTLTPTATANQPPKAHPLFLNFLNYHLLPDVPRKGRIQVQQGC